MAISESVLIDGHILMRYLKYGLTTLGSLKHKMNSC